jgi:Stage II sporulation protein E (SpoIIE)
LNEASTGVRFHPRGDGVAGGSAARRAGSVGLGLLIAGGLAAADVADADEKWEPHTASVRPGDVLVLYSDGLVDADGAEERFGPERLQQTLTGSGGASDALARIEEAVSHLHVGAQADDIAVLAVERVGVPVTAEGEESAQPGGQTREQTGSETRAAAG